jgi:uncharacterized membrane protein YccF (DUF307 family)
MGPIDLVLNLIWLVCGGLAAAVAWFFAALLFLVSIIGIPWAGAAFRIGLFTLWPFGQTVVDRRTLTGREDLGSGPFGTLLNIIWFVVCGWWLALGHVACAVLLGITIIGLPFAWQHLKLAGLALWPIGVEVVPRDVADMARWSR